MTESDDREPEFYILNEPQAANEESTSRRNGTADWRSKAVVDDHQLVSAYSHGDELAFEILVEKYFRMVYTVAARQTGDSHLAEEIAQSVFLVFSRKARGFSTKISIPGWFLRTTRFVCRDAIKQRLRRQQNERKLASNVDYHMESNSHPSTMEVLLEEAIQTLHPDEQAGLFARFFEGKDFQEIAQMFAITEHAARKRTSRCLAKLQNFMAKRGAKVSPQTLSSLLVLPPAQEVAQHALPSALAATHAVWKGKVAAPHILALARRSARLLRWRFWAGLSLKLASPVLIIFVGLWAVWHSNRPVSARMEQLGRAWGGLDQRIAQHRQFLMTTPPNTPGYQAKVQAELGAIGRESAGIIAAVKPLLAPPDERSRLAMFLTAELVNSLNLDEAQKTNLFSYVQNRLAQGATLNDAMKAIAATTQTETPEIKAMLWPAQRRQFDQIYGPDGVLLFSYPKAVALGQIGP
ncbi:MAG TPA: sigma-70 family RNA polymerase sigma factor [Verrucomicrobiae bacterium]|nr:sigma-70 family RNA polymerase sigma factor [Verrucomicrobiae bacterium]